MIPARKRSESRVIAVPFVRLVPVVVTVAVTEAVSYLVWAAKGWVWADLTNLGCGEVTYGGQHTNQYQHTNTQWRTLLMKEWNGMAGEQGSRSPKAAHIQRPIGDEGFALLAEASERLSVAARKHHLGVFCGVILCSPQATTNFFFRRDGRLPSADVLLTPNRPHQITSGHVHSCRLTSDICLAVSLAHSCYPALPSIPHGAVVHQS